MTCVFHMYRVWIIKAKVQLHETKLISAVLRVVSSSTTCLFVSDTWLRCQHEISFQDIFNFELNKARNKLSKDVILAVMEKRSRSLPIRAELRTQRTERCESASINTRARCRQWRVPTAMYQACTGSKISVKESILRSLWYKQETKCTNRVKYNKLIFRARKQRKLNWRITWVTSSRMAK